MAKFPSDGYCARIINLEGQITKSFCEVQKELIPSDEKELSTYDCCYLSKLGRNKIITLNHFLYDIQIFTSEGVFIRHSRSKHRLWVM